MTPGSLVLGLLVPGLLAALGSFVGWRLWRAGTDDARSASRARVARLGTTLGLVAGFAVACRVFFGGWPPAPSRILEQSVDHWFVYIALLAGVAGAVRCGRRWLPGTRAFGASLACAGVAWMITSPLVRSEYFEGRQFLTWLVVVSAALIVSVASLDGLGRHERARGAGPVLLAMTLVAAPNLLLWNTLNFAQVMGALGVIALAWTALGAWRQRFALSHGASSAFALFWATCVSASVLYGSPETHTRLQVAAGFTIASSLGWMAGEVPLVRRKLPGWGAIAVRTLATLAVGGVGLALTMTVEDVRELMELV